MKKMLIRNKFNFFGVIVILLLCALIFVIIGRPITNISTNFIFNTDIEKSEAWESVNSSDALSEVVQNNYVQFSYGLGGTLEMDDAITTNEEGTKSESDTNVQVEGVNEGDYVKYSNDKIFVLNDSKISIFDTKSDITLIDTIEYAPKDEHVYTEQSEMYVDDNYLTLIYYRYDWDYDSNKDNSKTIINLYDLETYELVREVSLSGYNISTRKIDNIIYIVSSNSIYNILKPLYVPEATDSMNKSFGVSYDEIYYQPGEGVNQFVNIMALNTTSNVEPKVTSYLGSASEIYMDEDSIYVVGSVNYACVTDVIGPCMVQTSGLTSIHKFSVNGTAVKPLASVKINGYIHNQFSLDEHNGYLRVVATTGSSWDDSSLNFVYILDKNLEYVSSVNNIAEGESVKSVRFDGDTLYLVTYKQVDPLFVIDMSNPKEPKVVGELKIPGFSTYMHPVDEDYVLGVGVDTIFKDDFESRNGLKVSLYDVSSPIYPKEIFSTNISDAYSEMEYNHKALTVYDDMYGFGYTKYENESKDIDDGISSSSVDEDGGEESPEYDYRYTATKYFVLYDYAAGSLTELHTFTINDGYSYSYNYHIRGIIINNLLYIIDTNNLIKVYDLNNEYELVSELDI